MPVKFFSSPRRAFAYRPFHIAALALFQGRIDEDLDKLAGSNRPRANSRSARYGEINATITISPASTRSFATSATRRMFSTRSASVNPKIPVEAMANVVAVENVGVLAVGMQSFFQQVGDRRLARARKPGEPKAARLLVLDLGARGFGDLEACQ